MADKWYYREGSDSDVVVSSRIRLARNLTGVPFPGRASSVQLNEMVSSCRKACEALPSIRFQHPADLSAAEGAALMEKHLVSPQFMEQKSLRCLALSVDEGLSIMIGEEDILRIQSMCAGNDLNTALQRAVEADQTLEKTLSYATHPTLGYLTHCPTNLGTGMRASVMLHLPAMTETGAIRRLRENAGKLGLVLRGSHGEGSAVAGDLYQLSNQVTLGFSEEEIVQKLITVTTQVIAEERALRANMIEADPLALSDRVSRALAVLQSARLLSSKEFYSLFSILRMGLACGLVKGVTYSSLDALFITAEKGGITLLSGAKDARERDIARADLCRKTLQSAILHEKKED